MGESTRQIPQIDLGGQYDELRADIDAAIARVIRASAFIGGEVADFECEFAAYLGARHVIGVANGTDALEIALQALGIGAGDVVLTPAFTFIATIEAIIRVGATPLLADIDGYCTLDVAAAISHMENGRVRAVVPVHLFGQPADMDCLMGAALAHGIPVVEDAAQAHGARCNVAGQLRRVGSIGSVGCFSFYPTKNLGAMGDGGAVVTNDDEIAERVRLIANHGERSKYEHVLATGRNSRLDALQAAVLRVKLGRLDAWNQRRRDIAAMYGRLLPDLPLQLPHERPGSECVYHQYAVRTAKRSRVQASLSARGIGTAIHYPRAVHQLEPFRHLAPAAPLHVAAQAAAEVLSLPMHPHLTDDDVQHVARALHETLV